jgi:hypothetical protein
MSAVWAPADTCLDDDDPARGGAAYRGAVSFYQFSDLDIKAQRFFLALVVVASPIRDGE